MLSAFLLPCSGRPQSRPQSFILQLDRVCGAGLPSSKLLGLQPGTRHLSSLGCSVPPGMSCSARLAHRWVGATPARWGTKSQGQNPSTATDTLTPSTLPLFWSRGGLDGQGLHCPPVSESSFCGTSGSPHDTQPSPVHTAVDLGFLLLLPPFPRDPRVAGLFQMEIQKVRQHHWE